jgi:hypothetical protein
VFCSPDPNCVKALLLLVPPPDALKGMRCPQ